MIQDALFWHILAILDGHGFVVVIDVDVVVKIVNLLIVVSVFVVNVEIFEISQNVP
jgi:hypothetical protein